MTKLIQTTTPQIIHIYNALEAVDSVKLHNAIKAGRPDLIANIAPATIDEVTAADVLQFGCKLKAEKMVEPYKLDEYIAYIYRGTLDDFARRINVTPAHIMQEIWSGNYWHGGTICSLVPTGRYRTNNNDNNHEPDVANFVARGLLFGEGRSHVKDMWAAYVLTKGVNEISRIAFGRSLESELKKRGYVKKDALRIGAAVSTGYIDISVKPLDDQNTEPATLSPDVIEPDVMDFISEHFKFAANGVLFINDAWKEYQLIPEYKTMNKKRFIHAVAYDMSLRGYEIEGAVVGNRIGDAYKGVSL